MIVMVQGFLIKPKRSISRFQPEWIQAPGCGSGEKGKVADVVDILGIFMLLSMFRNMSSLGGKGNKFFSGTPCPWFGLL
jgi:hypothetical protein